MKEEIQALQDTVRKLEERIIALEQAGRTQEAKREATAVNKAMRVNAATIRKLEED